MIHVAPLRDMQQFAFQFISNANFAALNKIARSRVRFELVLNRGESVAGYSSADRAFDSG